MSAHWSMAYLSTDAPLKRVLQTLRAALSAEIDQHLSIKIYRSGFHTVAYPVHTARRCSAGFDSQPLFARDEANLLLYPRHNDLYTLEFISFFSPEMIMYADQEREPALPEG